MPDLTKTETLAKLGAAMRLIMDVRAGLTNKELASFVDDLRVAHTAVSRAIDVCMRTL